MRKVILAIVAGFAIAVLVAGATTGCRKYQTPEYESVGTSETAFVVPLEGDSAKGLKLDSEAAYDKYKVMEKRILITKRWNKTGRMYTQGEWIPTIKVIKVERTPVTREWTADENSGTKNENEAIWVESSDSVGFSVGFNCTAHIQEADAARFLYWYKGNTLASVMDQEIRNRIQQVASEVAAKYDLDELREKKLEIIGEVRKDVIPFFELRGITVTTIGMFGGFQYENPKIQEAIDAVFIAQQLKNEEKAKLAAMEDKKTRMLKEGEATANQERMAAKGKADAIESVAKAEAEGIKMKAKAEAESILAIAKALQTASDSELFYKIKALEIEKGRIEKWSGDVPTMIMGGNNGNFVPMMQIPTNGRKK